MTYSSASTDGSSLSPDMKYELVREIAQGSNSKIYMARELGTGKALAVKIFNKPNQTRQQLALKLAIRHEVQMLELVQGGVSISITRLM
jgi:serine/threonine protein kinase